MWKNQEKMFKKKKKKKKKKSPSARMKGVLIARWENRTEQNRTEQKQGHEQGGAAVN